MNNNWIAVTTSWDPQTFPQTGKELFLLVEDDDNECEPFVIKVVMHGELPHKAVFKLVDPTDDQDPVLLQQYTIIAWRYVC